VYCPNDSGVRQTFIRDIDPYVTVGSLNNIKSIRDLELPLLNVYFFTDEFFSLQISVRFFFVIIVLSINIKIIHCPFSDHDIKIMKLNVCDIARGSGTWIMNLHRQ
jgi:hypothetical protein